MPAIAAGILATSAHAESEPAVPEERMVHPLYGMPAAPLPARRNAVQAELGLGVIGLAYERTLTDRVALQLEAQTFGTWWGPFFELPRFSGFGGQIRPTFFVTNDAPRGVYIAPFFRGAAVSATANDVTGRGFGWSLGAFVGYAFMLGTRVNLRIGAGAQYMSYAVDAGTVRIEWKRLYPALDLVVGYHF